MFEFGPLKWLNYQMGILILNHSVNIMIKKCYLPQAFITTTPIRPIIGTSVHSICEVVVLNKKDQEHSKAVEQFGHLHHFDKELGRHCKRKQKKPLSELRFSN